MAISATKLHAEFRRRVNRGDTSKNNDFSVLVIDSYLNEAQDIFYTNRLSVLETNPQVREDLRKAEVKQYCDKCKFYSKDNRICLVQLPKDYYRRIKQTLVASCDDERNCQDKELIIRIAQNDDISEILKDPFQKPSFEYERAWGDEGEDGLYIYHNNAYKVQKVCINYYKILPRIAAPSLVDPDGYYINGDGNKVEIDQGYLLDTTDSWLKVVDIAALIAARDAGNMQDYQSELQKILQISKF